MSNRILTVVEAAAALQLHPDTVRERLRKGELPGRRVGRSWRITEESLLRYLETDVQHHTDGQDHDLLPTR